MNYTFTAVFVLVLAFLAAVAAVSLKLATRDSSPWLVFLGLTCDRTSQPGDLYRDPERFERELDAYGHAEETRRVLDCPDFIPSQESNR